VANVATSNVDLNPSAPGSALEHMLTGEDIRPGDTPSYELCKTIYLYHPLGAKMAESPIKMAQSQERQISVPDSPEDRVRDVFVNEWDDLGIDGVILNVMAQSRVYGAASVAILTEGDSQAEPLDFKKLADAVISFNVYDPLNTAGSLVTNQNPNAMDFQKTRDIAVQGQGYHRSRTMTMLNESPIYIAYTPSAFGYVGRSVYQRALFPLKSFIQTMVTDDLVAIKAGVVVAKLKPAGSPVDNIMRAMAGIKRAIIKIARAGNVISVGHEEDIESLNLQNLEGPAELVRTNILKNIATAADMPAKLLENETMVDGFGEGTEDAKAIAKYVTRVRKEMKRLYTFMDQIVQYRAWTPAFYKTIQRDFPDPYATMDYAEAFYRWRNSFKAEWPNLLEEPDSEKGKTEKVKLDAILQAIEAIAGMLDPENKAKLIGWAADNMNANRLMFTSPLVLDLEALAAYVPPAAGAEGGEGTGERADSALPPFLRRLPPDLRAAE